MVDIIAKKRDGKELTATEIDFFIQGLTVGDIPDYQASALMMAIYFQGLNSQETTAITTSMINSGEKLDLSSISGIKVDKHSTGGVGDKTSIVLGPLVAAAGVPVAKLSGRGLGHTGGTIDKLEAFDGFNVSLSEQQFLKNIEKIGIAIIAQTANLAPADKILYALRDVTATVENKSLIAGSIMSKKIASGADAIVLDVKCGAGSFMKTPEDAHALAEIMVNIGNGLGKPTVALITGMEQPLGNAIGNSIEVIEAIETLKGNGPDDLTELCIELGAQLLILGGVAKDEQAAKCKLQEAIDSGAALEKLKQFVEAQGGDANQVTDTSLLLVGQFQKEIKAKRNGFIQSINAEFVGMAAMNLGAGRETKESEIDLSAGIYLHKKVGEQVQIGEPLATLYSADASKLAMAENQILAAFTFSKEPVEHLPLILEKVEK